MRPRAERGGYSGPFRIEPTRITAQRDLRTRANQVLNVAVEVSWEPRLRPIRIRQRGEDFMAVDSAGNTWAAANASAVLEPTVRPGTAAVEITLPLTMPPRSATWLAQLRGSLLVLMPGGTESFRFDGWGAAANVEKRIAGTTVTLECAEGGNGGVDREHVGAIRPAGGSVGIASGLDFQERSFFGRARGEDRSSRRRGNYAANGERVGRSVYVPAAGEKGRLPVRLQHAGADFACTLPVCGEGCCAAVSLCRAGRAQRGPPRISSSWRASLRSARPTSASQVETRLRTARGSSGSRASSWSITRRASGFLAACNRHQARPLPASRNPRLAGQR